MPNKTIHILLVEDNEGDILLVKDAFEEAKIIIDLSVVTNGQSALDFLRKKGPYQNAHAVDLVLLDVNLPILDGHEVLKQAKSDPQLRAIPVVMLTTSSSPKDIERARANDVNSYITKPLNVNEFLKVVIEACNFWIEIISIRTIKS